MNPSLCRVPLAAALLFFAVAMNTRSGSAQTATWTGGGGDGLWSTTSNWSAAPPGTGGTLVFSGTTRTTGTNDAAVTSAAVLNFTNDATAGATAAFMLSGSALGLTGATGIQTTAVTNGNVLTDTVSLDLALAGATGTTTVSTGAAHHLRLMGGISGNGGLTKTGAGTIFLWGNNTYSGTTTVAAGTLNLWNGAGLGLASNGVLLDGGTLELGATYVGDALAIGGSGGTIKTSRNFTAMLASAGLTGSGTLTIAGGGTLRAAEANSGFTGPVMIANDGGVLALRDAGTLTGVSRFTVNPGGTLMLDDTGSTNVVSRISTSSTVALPGGSLTFLARNSAGNSSATVGTVDVSAAGGFAGPATITATKAGQGASLTIGNLIRGTGAGTVNFVGTTFSGTSSGDISRVFLTQLNGAAVTGSSWLGGWATVNGTDFAAYSTPVAGGGGVVVPGSAGAPSYTTLTAATAPGSGGWAATNVGDLGSTTGTMTLGAAGAGQNFSVLALRLGNGAAAATIGFAGTSGTPDTLHVGNGGVLQSLSNQRRDIGVSGGTAYTKGRITAGDIGLSGTAPVELFLHSTANSGVTVLAINSQIIDNPGGGGHPLTVIARGASVQLSSSNSYSGGTQVIGAPQSTSSSGGGGSPLTASVASSLGTGKVFVNNSGQLALSAAGASTYAGSLADPTYTVANGGQISIPNVARLSNEFISVDGSSALALGGTTGGASWDVGTNLALAPGAAIVASTLQVAESLRRIGGQSLTTLTTPTWYWGLVNTNNTNVTGTIGPGTPWLGISHTRLGLSSCRIDSGTLTVNGDFQLRSNFSSALILGNTNASLTFATSRPTQAFVLAAGLNGTLGTSAIQLGTGSASYGSNDNPFTFVVTSGATIHGLVAGGMGVSGSMASIVAQNGGSLTLAVPDAFNGAITMQAGSRLQANNASGLTGTGQLTFENGSIIDIVTQANGFSGSQAAAATINPGTIVRLGVASIANGATGPVDAILGGKAGVTGVTYELTGGSPANPASTATILTLNSSAGGIGGFLTNDSSARTLAATANGSITIGSNGGGIAATTNAALTVTEEFSLGSNLLTIGLDGSIDGNPKLGTVILNSTTNTNTGAQGSRVSVIGGATLQLGVANQIPDATVLNIAGTFDMNKLNETVAALTGSGTVGNGSTAASVLTIQGGGSASTFSGVIRNVLGAGNSTVGLTITGSADQTLSGVNNYTGTTTVSGGMLTLANSGALPGGIGITGGSSGLTFNGGVLGLGTGNDTFARSLGSGTGNVLFTGDGGWAAVGADRTVNLGGSSGQVVWATGTTGFNGRTLIFGGASATHMVNLQNPIDLGSSTRTAQVDDGAAPIEARMSGVLSGSGGFTKTGAGALELTGTNTYTGVTAVSAGVLAFSSIANSGAASALGAPTTGSNSIIALSNAAALRYTGTGGHSTNRTINLATTAAGTATLDASGSGRLTLGSITASGSNKMLLLTGTSLADNEVGVIGDASSGKTSLVKADPGRWVLSGSNTFSGDVSVNEGQLVLAVSAEGGGNGSLGTYTNATISIGSATGSGTAALLFKSGVMVGDRKLTIPQISSGSQAVVIGAIDGSGTATFGTGSDPQIALGRDVTLQAATNGTLVFRNAWSQASGTSVSVTIGSADNAGTVVIGQPLAASGSVRIDRGTLRLTALNSATGSLASAANVVVGTAGSVNTVLDVAQTGSSAAYVFGAGQTVSGIGTIQLDTNTPVSIAGVFSPGNSPGIFTFEGDGSGGATTLAGTTFMEITGTARGAMDGYDAVNLTSGATLGLGGTLELWFSGTFANDTKFNLFTLTGAGVSGNFTNVSVSGSSSAYTGLSSWTESSGTWTSPTTAGGQALKFSSTDGTLVVVPEPATLVLAAIGIGLAGWAAVRLRK